MKKALVLASALFLFAGCSTQPSDEEKFLSALSQYKTITFAMDGRPFVTIESGGRILKGAAGSQIANDIIRFQKASSPTKAEYANENKDVTNTIELLGSDKAKGIADNGSSIDLILKK